MEELVLVCGVADENYNTNGNNVSSIDKRFVCDLCKQRFTKKANLGRYILNIHSVEKKRNKKDTRVCVAENHRNNNPATYRNTTNVNKTFVCDLCNKRFTTKANLKCHIIKIHIIRRNMNKKYSRRVVTKCPLCDDVQLQVTDLLLHFVNYHGISVEKESLKFDTEQHFEEWKKEIEHSTYSRYIQSKPKQLKRCEVPSMRYVCHRSGKYIPKGVNKRRLKVQGSCKINGYCPSEIHVIKSVNDGYIVNFTKTHVGHSNDLTHINLTKEDRDLVAENIAIGIPFHRIIEDIRFSMTDGVERVHLLNRKDLHNIVKSYNLKNISVHTDDVESIETWINDNEDSVLLYKQGDVSQEYDQFINNTSVDTYSNAVGIQEIDELKKYFEELCGLVKTADQFAAVKEGLLTLIAELSNPKTTS